MVVSRKTAAIAAVVVFIAGALGWRAFASERHSAEMNAKNRARYAAEERVLKLATALYKEQESHKGLQTTYDAVIEVGNATVDKLNECQRDLELRSAPCPSACGNAIDCRLLKRALEQCDEYMRVTTETATRLRGILGPKQHEQPSASQSAQRP